MANSPSLVFPDLHDPLRSSSLPSLKTGYLPLTAQVPLFHKNRRNKGFPHGSSVTCPAPFRRSRTLYEPRLLHQRFSSLADSRAKPPFPFPLSGNSSCSRKAREKIALTAPNTLSSCALHFVYRGMNRRKFTATPALYLKRASALSRNKIARKN